MTKQQIEKLILSICDKHKVFVECRSEFQKDYGECYPDLDKILLGTKYSSSKIKFAVFLHELGHILTIRRRGTRYLAASIFQEESAVWTLAQELHFKYTQHPFSKAQANFMLRCLDTYSQYHYSFVKKFNKDYKKVKI